MEQRTQMLRELHLTKKQSLGMVSFFIIFIALAYNQGLVFSLNKKCNCIFTYLDAYERWI